MLTSRKELCQRCVRRDTRIPRKLEKLFGKIGKKLLSMIVILLSTNDEMMNIT
jgi:hypothetical protein